jgi:hypothetical protein
MSGFGGRTDGRRAPDGNAAMQHYSYAQNDEIFAHTPPTPYITPMTVVTSRLTERVNDFDTAGFGI